MSFSKNMLWNSIGSLVYLACNWLTTVLVVTLTNSYEGSGQLAVAMAVGNIFSTIMLFRVRAVQVSDLKNQYTSSDYIGFRCFTLIISSCFCFIYSLFTVDSRDYLVVFIYLCFKAVESFADVYHGIDQKVDRFDIIGMSQILRGIAIIVSFVLGLTLSNSLLLSIGLMTVSNLFLLLVFDASKASEFDSVRPRFSSQITYDLMKRCTPGFIGMLTCTMVISIVRQSFANEFGSEQLGIYAAIAAPTVIAQALASYVYAPMIVPISKLWADGDTDNIMKYLIRFFKALVLIIFLCVIMGHVLGERIFSIVYGTEITDYLYLLNPLLICTGLTALLYFLQDVLVVFDSYAEIILSGMVALALAIATKNWFFSVAGMNGITITIICAYGTSVALIIAFIWSKLKTGRITDRSN